MRRNDMDRNAAQGAIEGTREEIKEMALKLASKPDTSSTSVTF